MQPGCNAAWVVALRLNERTGLGQKDCLGGREKIRFGDESRRGEERKKLRLGKQK